MVGKALSRALFILALVFCVLSPASIPARSGSPAPGRTASPQDFPEQKPKFDYMSTFLRGRKPLGLKEDLIMKRLLRQSRASWAVRAGLRHILD
ncbi:MAG: hypothetical protein MUP28_06920 [Candidatus Aminicenantes bacterium]|nr:hypothetical protein [Candidatus Aminicenantes bacterium]